MAIWVAKAALQKFASLTPWGHQLNGVFQRYLTQGLDLSDDLFASRASSGKQHLAVAAGFCPEPATALEVGTGWFPVVPCLLALRGWTVDTIDLASHLSSRRVVDCFAQIHGARDSEAPLPDRVQGRLDWIERWVSADADDLPDDPHELLGPIGVTAHVGKLEDLGLTGPYEFVCSTSTLEHVQNSEIFLLLGDLRDRMSASGVGSHLVDLSDHYSHLDKRISPLNFLRFSPKFWNFIDNSIQPQNRLRFSDYERLFSQLGMSMITSRATREAEVEATEIKLHSDYASAEESDLRILGAHFVVSLDSKQVG